MKNPGNCGLKQGRYESHADCWPLIPRILWPDVADGNTLTGTIEEDAGMTSVRIGLSADAVEALQRPVIGQGGFQAFCERASINSARGTT